VKYIAKACEEQGAVLTGGETSEQPGVLEPGTYVLGASCIGVVDKDAVIDGSKIKTGDTVLAVESSGPHTNGYSLIRALIKEDPTILQENIGTKSFLGAIMEPHRCYFNALKDLFANPALHGMAHITGGGIPGNLNRILPEGLDSEIDAGAIQILPVFHLIKKRSGNDDADMIKTFNLGVGLTLVVDPKAEAEIIKHLKKHSLPGYPIGKIVKDGSQNVRMTGALKW
jgi:phosphoribosylformylglycinamidine cyclo-ligase